MPDTIPTSSPSAGSAPSPAAPNDPAGAGAPAPSEQQPATSGSAPPTGTTAPSPSTPSASDADQAFEAYLAESHDAPPDNRQQPTAPPAAPPPEPQAPGAQQAQPTDPVAEPSDGPELDQQLTPSAEEQAKGLVPVKNLTRALTSRRKAIDRANDLQARLDRESQLVDKVIGTFQAAGVDVPNLPAFLGHLAKAKSDPQAQAAILAHFGIQAPQPARPAFDVAEVAKRLEAYDVEGALSIVRGQAQTPPAPQQPPAQPPVAAPPVAQPTPQQQIPADMSQIQLQAQVQAMAHTLQATYGQQEAARLSTLIDQAAHARVTELRDYGVEVSPRAIAKVYLEAHGKVLQAEAQRRARPVSPPPSAQTLRPAPAAPPRKLTADEQFEAEFGRG
ncbi:MAG: hypothetical protein RL513_455 [Pseudomonadota bacterium]|jgi:hypothetical protein